jgi:dynactin 1
LLVSAQRQARDLQSENTHLETRATEALDQLEMAALDREVAEEKAEAAEAELAKLNEKISELELEVAVLQEENGGSCPVLRLRVYRGADQDSGIRETGR